MSGLIAVPGEKAMRWTRTRGLALLAAGLLAGCAAGYDPYAGHTPEERAKLQADDTVRMQEHFDGIRRQQEDQLALETLSTEMLAQRIRAGDASPVYGVRARGSDRFEGRMDFLRDPYTNRLRASYGKGTYYSLPGHGMPLLPSNGQYRGDIKYFADPPREGRLRTGTHVLAGEFTRHDGVQDVGIYVAEHVLPEQPLHFVKATPGYLDRLAASYAGQVQAFRQEEQRRLQAERSGGGDLFGPLLALGLGGLILSSADIPGADVAKIGSALFQDVMSDGQTQALANIARSGQGSYGVGPGAAAAGGSSAGAVVAGVGGVLAAAGGPAAGAGQARAAGQTSQYSFSCPAGHSSVVPISYKSASCLAAKQEMTRIYACNLVDQFDRVASLCTQGCGSPQCAE